MGWHDLRWKHLLDVESLITTQDVGIAADTIARIFNVPTIHADHFYSAPVMGEKRSVRVFSRNPFEGGISLPPMSCLDLAASIWEISHKTGEARYYPEQRNGCEKGWEVMKGRILFFPPMPCVIAGTAWVPVGN